jgi:hypothetical protein
MSWFELGYWNTSPSDDDEVLGESVDSNDEELEESDQVTDVWVF